MFLRRYKIERLRGQRSMVKFLYPLLKEIKVYIYINTQSCFTLSYSGVRHIKIKANDPQQVLTNKSMEETATVSHAGT